MQKRMPANMVNDNPKISVIIPSFNKGDYIEKTLESIFKQKYKNFEVIIQDGGSVDKTILIIQKYKKTYSNQMTYVSKKDKGQLDAINTGMKKAKGDILTYINADDYFEPGAFEKVMTAHKLHRRLWYAGRGRMVDGADKEIAGLWMDFKKVFLYFNRYTLLLCVNYLMQPSVFMTRKAYERIKPLRGTNKFITEYDTWLTLGKMEMPFVIRHTLSSFRLPQGSITSTNYKNLLLCDEKILKKYTNNPLIIGVHKLINILRVITIKNIKIV